MSIKGASINRVYGQVQKVANKNQKGGYLDSDTFNRYARLSQLDWFNDAYRMYDGGQKNWDDISVLRAKPKILTVDANGEFRYPTDYWHLSNLVLPNMTSDGFKPKVEIIGDYEVSERTASELTPVTYDYPIAVLYDDYVQVYPANVGRVEMSYLKRFPAPYWNYTVSSSRKVFAEAAGVATNVNIGKSFDASTISSSTITITAHGYKTGQSVYYTANDGTDVSGLSSNVEYFVIRVAANTLKLAQTYADAIAGNAIAVSSGSGTQYLAEFPNILSGDSTDFLVPDYAINDLVYRICFYLGIYLRDAELTGISKQSENGD